MEEIKPKYQYKRLDSNRKLKNAFFFYLNGTKTKVCKTFFKNTLNITDRCIRTVIEKKNNITGVLKGEQRGKHGKHRKIPDDLIDGVQSHIKSIPRIESHYLRQQTTKEYIDGGKTLTDIYCDYKDECMQQGLPYVMLHTYRKIFKEKFNISFFIPKKDQCEQCCIYKLAEGDEKAAKKEAYDWHLAEKDKSREEKSTDKEMVSSSFIVACYDLQAVMSVPNGEISTFYYKSKINCLNFTISELKHDTTECFFWDESQGNRGANEIGSCVLKYLQKKSSSADEDLEIIFYSDNCCGQQKNQFIIGMYIYAVLHLNIKCITHKFLIRGHTQNEGDAVHSLIEKQVKRGLRSGPIYVPSQYVSAIRGAKKRGTPFSVNEMGYGDFIDIKQLPVPRLNKSVDGQVVKLSDIKVIKIEKNEHNEIKIQYKLSYFDDFKDLDLTKRTNNRNNRPPELKPLYLRKLDISERKKNDVRSLIDAGLIPSYYTSYYESIFQ